MEIKVVEKDSVVLARLIPSESWGEGLTFFSNESEFLQVGSWKYNQGKLLASHRHNIVPRSVQRTQEVLFVKKGKIEANIYDNDNQLVDTLVVHEGDVLVLLDGGHGYRVIEDNTQVLEIKNGPYLGAEIDRTRL